MQNISIIELRLKQGWGIAGHDKGKRASAVAGEECDSRNGKSRRFSQGRQGWFLNIE
jgi:hypothetical protein